MALEAARRITFANQVFTTKTTQGCVSRQAVVRLISALATTISHSHH